MIIGKGRGTLLLRPQVSTFACIWMVGVKDGEALRVFL